MTKSEEYILRLYKIASISATDYKNAKLSRLPISVLDSKRERFIRYIYQMWGAVQALSLEDLIPEDTQLKYESLILGLDDIFYS